MSLWRLRVFFSLNSLLSAGKFLFIICLQISSPASILCTSWNCTVHMLGSWGPKYKSVKSFLNDFLPYANLFRLSALTLLVQISIVTILFHSSARILDSKIMVFIPENVLFFVLKSNHLWQASCPFTWALEQSPSTFISLRHCLDRGPTVLSCSEFEISLPLALEPRTTPRAEHWPQSAPHASC